ncbi:MAG: hypothetical protein IIZ44_06770 [Muribaculaceae bacterium]|nr:hypothetical protein [Muribaculaceae bacterium]
MVEISNSQRDQAVRLLRFLTQTSSEDNSLKAVNARRLATRLANQLEKREKK